MNKPERHMGGEQPDDIETTHDLTDKATARHRQRESSYHTLPAPGV